MTAQMLRAAALQMVSGPDQAANLKQAESLIARAASAGASLVVLPESFALFGDAQALRASAALEAGDTPPLQGFLAAQARRHGIYLVGGTVAVAAADGRATASVFCYEPDGEQLGRYDKIHLFDAEVGDGSGGYRESRDYCPGDSLCVVETPFGMLGVVVCYDIRFPEMMRLMQRRGLDILVVPAAFTRHTGLAHWLPLLRARAIENQCFVIGANQGGVHSARRQTSGGSVLIDAWGEVLAEAGFGAQCLVADLDLSMLARLRKSMPVAEHRRYQVAE